MIGLQFLLSKCKVKGEMILEKDPEKYEVGKQIYEQVADHFTEILEMKDKVLGNEYVQLAGEAFKVGQLVIGLNQLIVSKKFDAFLKGFTEENIPTEKQLQKLMKYVDDESKAEFISDTFSKVFLANSSKCCLLMGTLLKAMVDEGGEMQHEKLICVAALTNFFDIDLKNYKLIFDYITWKNERSLRIRVPGEDMYAKNFWLDNLRKFTTERSINRASFLMTLEKAVGSQLLIRSYDSDVDVSYDADMETTSVDNSDILEYYKFSEAGLLLRDYFKRMDNLI